MFLFAFSKAFFINSKKKIIATNVIANMVHHVRLVFASIMDKSFYSGVTFDIVVLFILIISSSLDLLSSLRAMTLSFLLYL